MKHHCPNLFKVTIDPAFYEEVHLNLFENGLPLMSVNLASIIKYRESVSEERGAYNHSQKFIVSEIITKTKND